VADREYSATDAQPVVPYGQFGSAIKKVQVDSVGNTLTMVVNSLVPKEYDTIELSYTGSDVTGVVYKVGTTTVATLTLTYGGAGGELTKVVRS